VPTAVLALLILLPASTAAATYSVARTLPRVRAVFLAREIDAKLPYALNYLATLAASGATPQALFASLARQPIYGAVAREAARLTRDIELLGCDVVSAMARAGHRTASAKWQDLLQGAITALTSGGDLRTYFRDKAEQFLQDNRQDQKRFLEGLGVLAECFVTVVVAAPLFLIVILSVMTSLGGSVEQTVVVGYTLVLVVLPVSQAGFILTIRTMTPEV
jgi:archaeal flagellar protein FlaJ